MPDPKLTPADVAADPLHYIAGSGRAEAQDADCSHGYALTSSCPGCDGDAED